MLLVGGAGALWGWGIEGAAGASPFTYLGATGAGLRPCSSFPWAAPCCSLHHGKAGGARLLPSLRPGTAATAAAHGDELGPPTSPNTSLLWQLALTHLLRPADPPSPSCAASALFSSRSAICRLPLPSIPASLHVPAAPIPTDHLLRPPAEQPWPPSVPAAFLPAASSSAPSSAPRTTHPRDRRGFQPPPRWHLLPRDPPAAPSPAWQGAAGDAGPGAGGDAVLPCFFPPPPGATAPMWCSATSPARCRTAPRATSRPSTTSAAGDPSARGKCCEYGGSLAAKGAEGGGVNAAPAGGKVGLFRRGRELGLLPEINGECFRGKRGGSAGERFVTELQFGSKVAVRGEPEEG